MRYNMENVVRGENIVHSNERYADKTNTLADVLVDLMLEQPC